MARGYQLLDKNNPNEYIILKGTGNRRKGKMSFENGQIILTNKRLLYGKRSGALWLLIGVFSTLIDADMSTFFLIEEITHIDQGFQGLNKNILIVHTRNGQTEEYAVKRFKDWEAAFQHVFHNVLGAEAQNM